MRDISCVVAPIACHAFFEKSQFERLFRDDLLEVLSLPAQCLDLVRVLAARAVSPASRFFPASMKSLDHL